MIAVTSPGTGTTASVPRVGLYVDGFNVYYGARGHCGRGSPGWRWLDLPALAIGLLDPVLWPQAQLTRIVYCTADRNRGGDPTSLIDQQTYIDALQHMHSHLEVRRGLYAPRDKTGVLVQRPSGSGRSTPIASPGLANIPAWLPALEVRGARGGQELLVSVSTFEEKGSDVNVATSLLVDVLEGAVDAAIVMSNDSDLASPLIEARRRVPVGTVNPTKRPTAFALRGLDSDGVGRHWWRKLTAADYFAHQLPPTVDGHSRPASW